MCTNSSTSLNPCNPLLIAFRNRRPSSRRYSLRHRPLNRRRMRLSKHAKGKKPTVFKTEMEAKNLKLYMENKNIIEENEKLRKRALLLHQENQALLLQLQMKFSS